MATDVIMPALGMAQETGTLVRWLKPEGAQVKKGEPLAEIMTDKAMVELEAPAAGVLAGIAAAEGEDVPVGNVIAHLLKEGESFAGTMGNGSQSVASEAAPDATAATMPASAPNISPLASRIAAAHAVDLSGIPANGRRIQKADVLSYLEGQRPAVVATAPRATRLAAASPKARRIARELGADIATISGSGPEGAVVTRDVLAATAGESNGTHQAASVAAAQPASIPAIWRVMAERTAQSWREIPHFFLLREANASRLVAWREQAQRHSAERITYTDLLVKVAAATLRSQPRLNASWSNGTVIRHEHIGIGLAVAIEDGLVVPVIHDADRLSLEQIARERVALVERAKSGKLRPDDVAGGTFTISNLGMYGVDAFNAIVNGPQAAILAVGRIVEKVVPVNGMPAVQPVMALSLSCDHRVVDGARGAQFLGTLADLIEEPLALLE